MATREYATNFTVEEDAYSAISSIVEYILYEIHDLCKNISSHILLSVLRSAVFSDDELYSVFGHLIPVPKSVSPSAIAQKLQECHDVSLKCSGEDVEVVAKAKKAIGKVRKEVRNVRERRARSKSAARVRSKSAGKPKIHALPIRNHLPLRRSFTLDATSKNSQ